MKESNFTEVCDGSLVVLFAIVSVLELVAFMIVSTCDAVCHSVKSAWSHSIHLYFSFHFFFFKGAGAD